MKTSKGQDMEESDSLAALVISYQEAPGNLSF